MELIDRFKAGVTAFKEAFCDGQGPMGYVLGPSPLKNLPEKERDEITKALDELQDLIASEGGCISIPVQHEEHKDGDRGSDGVE